MELKQEISWISAGDGPRNRERSVLSAEGFVKLAMIHLMLNRRERKADEAEFRYRAVA